MSDHEYELISNLRQARTDRELTQAELAERVGVSRQTINYIERGDYVPSVKLALLLASVLETTVEELFRVVDG